MKKSLYYRLIGRKKFFTAGRVGPFLPQASQHRTQKEHSKRRHIEY